MERMPCSPSIMPGRYSVSESKSGFKKWKQAISAPCIVLKIIQGIVKNISGKFVSYMVLLKAGKTCVPGVGEDTYQEETVFGRRFKNSGGMAAPAQERLKGSFSMHG